MIIVDGALGKITYVYTKEYSIAETHLCLQRQPTTSSEHRPRGSFGLFEDSDLGGDRLRVPMFIVHFIRESAFFVVVS